MGKASGVQWEEHPPPQSSAPAAGMPWAGSRHRDLRAGPPSSAEHVNQEFQEESLGNGFSKSFVQQLN